MQKILNLLRMIFDRSKSANEGMGDSYTYVGDDYWELTCDNASEITQVLIDGKIAPSGIYYEIDTDSNQFYISGLENGNVVNVKYKNTEYSDEELIQYIQEAICNYNLYSGTCYIFDDTDITPMMKPKQQNLIAFVTMILLKPNQQSYSIPNYKVTYPTRLNKDDRIKKIINKGLRNGSSNGGVSVSSGSSVQFN